MRVLVVTSYYEPARGFGGPVQSICALVSALNAAGVETVVLTTDADGIRPRCVPEPGWETREDVSVHYSRCMGFSKPSRVGRFFFAPAIALKVACLLPRFDLLHLQGTWVFPTLVGSRAAMLLDRPYVISAHGTLFPWALGHKSLKKRMYLSLIEEKTLRRAARLHYTTRLEARLAEVVFPGIPGAVIPNPVAPAPPDTDGMAFRNKLGIGATTPLVVFLGRIHAIKGLDLLVDAAASVVKEIPGTVVAMVGNDEGGHTGEIRDRIARRGLERNVILPGPVQGDGKWAAFAAADLFVLPSHQENFGMSAAEAMACGIPVVTSAAVGIAEDIAEAVAGLVVDRTPEAFAGAVVALLRDPAARRRMGDAGRELVARMYSPSVVARSMIRLYGDVIEEHAKRPVSRRAKWFRSVFSRRGREESR